MEEAFTIDSFLKNLIGNLAETLEEVVGLPESSGFIAVVGQKVGEEVNSYYQKQYGSCQLSREQVAESLVAMKKSIEGDFYVIHQDSKILTLGNHHCPFGEDVIGKSSLCMMTANVFGVVAAENLGYAKVELAKTIAKGHKECLVHIHLNPEQESTQHADGQEYYRL